MLNILGKKNTIFQEHPVYHWIGLDIHTYVLLHNHLISACGEDLRRLLDMIILFLNISMLDLYIHHTNIYTPFKKRRKNSKKRR